MLYSMDYRLRLLPTDCLCLFYAHVLRKRLCLHLRKLLLQTETERLVAAVEGNKLRLEHGVAVDLETGTLVALDTAEAGRVGFVDRRKGNLRAGNLGHVVRADTDGHVGKSGRAGVDETTNLGVQLGTGNRGVVGLSDLLVNKEKRCTGVGNGVRAHGVRELLVADRELGGCKLPEASLGLDGDPGHLSRDLGGVDLAKLIGTGAVDPQVSNENGLGEVSHDVVKESLRRSLLGAVVDSVEVRESKTNETISVEVIDERLRNLVGKLDGLALDLDASDGDSVGTNNSRSTRAVTVADLELSTLCGLESGRLGSIESRVLTNACLVKLSAEHPPRDCQYWSCKS
jgi:hypothetical protein